MKTKIFKRILVILCILTILLPMSSEVIAQITNSAAGQTQTFGIVKLHQSNKLDGTAGVKIGYRIDGKNAYRIYSGSDDANGYVDTVLCLDKDKPFPKEEDSSNRGTYTSLGEATQSTLNQAKSSITASDAQKIQWLIQNAILPEDSSDLRNQKLTQIFGDLLAGTKYTENPLTVEYIKSILTEDDIVFALQATIWKITNNTSLGSLQGSSDGTNWDALDGNSQWDSKGRKGIFIRHMVSYYQAHWTESVDTSPKTDPSFDTSIKPTSQIIGTSVFIGPFKINAGTNFYTINMEFENKAGQNVPTVNYQITDKASNQNVTVLKPTKEGLEGKEFYVRLPINTSIRKIKFRIVPQIKAGKSTGTVWTNGTENQPLLSIEREPDIPVEPIKYEYEFDIPVPEKQYDASLRKYITGIYRTNAITGGKQVIPVNDRAPGDTLIPATGNDPFNQYIYNHKKDPVEVQVGDIVVYTIQVYNECDNPMKITSIKDYLPPSGIEYEPTETININNEWQLGSDRTVTNAKGWVLDKKGASAKVQIACKVTEAARGRIITNIAEITGFTDENNKVVTDIDSQEKNVKLPSSVQDWDDYQGNEGTRPDGTPETSYKNQTNLADSNYYYKGQQDDDDFEKIIVKINSEQYDLQIVKVDKDDNTIKLANAEFEITLPDGTKQTITTNSNGIATTKKIEISEIGTDTIKIEEKKAPNGYKLLPNGFNVEVDKQVINGSYSINPKLVGEPNGVTMTKNGNTIIITIEDEKEEEEEEEGEYDIQLIKVEKGNTSNKLAGAKFEITMPDGSTKTLTTGQDGTVKTEKIKVTQEGTDTIKISETEAPTGYNTIIQDIELEITKELKEGKYVASKVRQKSNQDSVSVTSQGNTIIVTVENEKKEEPGEYNLRIIKEDKATKNKLLGAKFEITMPDGSTQTVITGEGGTVQIDKIAITKSETYTIKLKEIQAPSGYVVIPDNIEIEVTTELSNERKYVVKSARLKSNSSSVNVNIQNGDIVITIRNSKDIYDLALKKFITNVTSTNGTNKVIPESQKRKCEITDVEDLINRTLENPKADAKYKLNKTPVDVANGDYVTYCIRVFNEGTKDAIVKELVDTLPDGLEFVTYETNSDGSYKSGSRTNYTYGWEKFEGKQTDKGWTEGVRTEYLKDKTIKAFDKTKANGENKELGLSYIDVKIEFKVNLDKLTTEQRAEVLKNGIKNIAEITDDDDDDNDSEPDDKEEKEDDQDYDIVIPQVFDLALRKFITKINTTKVTDRIPKVTYENGQLKYNHTKEPKTVVEGQIVIYTIRVYNEGTQDGYATEITDDLPEGITFLPNHETNKEYEWKMYDKEGNETTDVRKAVKIKTRYLSRDKSEKNLLKAFDSTKPISDTNPSYKEVEVAFEVTQKSVTAGNKVIINTAQISEDEDKDGNEVDDIDSEPDNDEPDEDDIDKEYLILKYFDLSLLKFVSKVIVTEDGVTKETETGYNGTENPEPVVKVELNKNKLYKTDVKYVYSIKITNEGEIEGYATEITDRIPSGLTFFEEDNIAYNWKTKEPGIVTTDYLQNTLLKPGESATIQIVLRWERSEQNLGQKVNVAEISQDDNEYDVPDIDSTPNNNKDGEDDQDNAIVVLTIQTGKATTYIVLIITIMSILASGFYLIHKKVLK